MSGPRVLAVTMRLYICAAFFTLSASAAEVTTLTANNFRDAIVPNELWLVKFYAPWCGHCKRLAPILEEMAADEAAMGAAKIGKVDCTVEKALCTHFDVHGFPTLKMFHEDHMWEYKGSRNKASLEALFKRMQQPPVRELSSVDELNAAIDAASKDNAALFLLGAPPPGQATNDLVADSFKTAARQLQHRDTFVSSSNPKVLAELFKEGVAAAPFIARVEKGETPRLLKAPEPSSAEIISFVEGSRLPLFSLVNPANFYDLSSSGRPLVLLIEDPLRLGKKAGEEVDGQLLTLDDSNVAGSSAAALRSVARDESMGSRFVFAMLDVVANEEHINSTYFITRGDAPRLVVLHRSGPGGRGYRSFAVDKPGEAASEATMRSFLERISLGKVAFEYEGSWGMPDRWWRIAKGYVPALSALDFLPQYTFSGGAAVFVLVFIIYIIVQPDSPNVPEPEYNPPPIQKARMKKTD